MCAYLMLSLWALYSMAVPGGRLSTLLKMSLMRLVTAVSLADLFQMERMSSWNLIKETNALQSINKKEDVHCTVHTRTLELQIQYNNKAPWTVADLAKISTLFWCTQIWPTILKISAKTYCVIAFRKVAEFSFKKLQKFGSSTWFFTKTVFQSSKYQKARKWIRATFKTSGIGIIRISRSGSFLCGSVDIGSMLNIPDYLMETTAPHISSPTMNCSPSMASTRFSQHLLITHSREH